jgi:putative DNA primase/helicase
MKNDTIEAARGHWRDILPAIGIDAKFLTGKSGPCPICAGKDRWTFTDRNADGDFICRSCGAGKGLQLVMKVKGWDFKTAAHEVDQLIGNLPATAPRTRPKIVRPMSRDELNRIWRESKVIDGDPVAAYFHHRGLHILGTTFASVLRYAPALWHPYDKRKHPAMIAKICDAEGHAKHLHLTYLTMDGQKAKLDRVRLYTPGELPKGGAIRLGPEAETMGVAEGIETAISASVLYQVPVWATTSTAMLMNWQPPAIAKRVAIFADSDFSFAGQKAAFTLAERLQSESDRAKRDIDIDVLMPRDRGQDWNDLIQSMRQNMVAGYDPSGVIVPNTSEVGNA